MDFYKVCLKVNRPITPSKFYVICPNQRQFIVNSILGRFDFSQLAPFHWSISFLAISHLHVNSTHGIFRTFSSKKHKQSNC